VECCAPRRSSRAEAEVWHGRARKQKQNENISDDVWCIDLTNPTPGTLTMFSICSLLNAFRDTP